MPLHIDVESLALGRALVGLPGGKYLEQSVVVIDCGATFTGIYIFRKGWPAFRRTIPTAGDVITEAIREHTGAARELAERAKRQFANVASMGEEGSGGSVPSESGMFDSAYDESSGSEGTGPALSDLETIPATEMDTEAVPVPPAAKPAAAPPPADLPPEIIHAREVVGEAISQRIYDLVTEIGRSLDFYRRQHREEQVVEIMLAGGSAHLPGLAELIGGETGITTRIANPFEHIQSDGVATAEFLRDVGPNMAVALGLAMRDMLE
jgi:type IV pilus assembly protein PilM